MQNTLLQLSATPAFKVSEISYPRMRLSGSGGIIPAALASLKHFAYVSQFLSAAHFPENPEIDPWDDELVFFPVRRLSRIPNILRKFGLHPPTYHHAAAFGLAIKDSPVVGPVIFPHEPVVIPALEALGKHRVSYVVERSSLACVCYMHVLTRPAWVVGLV